MELVEQRTLAGKVFALGGEEYRAELSVAPVHVALDPAAWMRGEPSPLVDIDLSWETDGQTLHLRRAWYDLTIAGNQVGYRYQDKTTGAVLYVTLLRVGAGLVTPPPRIQGSQLWWDDVAPGVDVYLDLRPASVEIFKRIRHESAPRSFVWELKESLPAIIGFSTLTRGWDRERPLQLMYDVGPETVHDGFRCWSVTETWTGRTIVQHPLTRKSRLSSEVVYPVLIDFDVSVVISDYHDDGNEHSNTGYWNAYASVVYTNPTLTGHWGARFLSLAIPQGATITLATLTYWVSAKSVNAGAGATLFARAHDSAPAWANNAGPINMTPTTASLPFTFGSGSSLGSNAIDVSTLVQEVVNRAGWVSGNNLAFGTQGTLSGSYPSTNIYDRFSGSGAKVSKLDINFTVGATVTYPELERGIRGLNRGIGGG